MADVKRSAPGWAEELSKQALKSIPDARKRLEDTVLEQIAENLKQADLVTEQHFRTFLSKNKDKLATDLKHLSTSDKLADGPLEELAVALDEALQTDLKEQSKQALKGLSSLVRRMKHLRANKGLTQEETLERRLVQVCRRLQMEKVDPALLTLIPEEKPTRPFALPVKGAPRSALQDLPKPKAKGPAK